MNEEFIEPTVEGRRNMLLVFLGCVLVLAFMQFFIRPALLAHIKSLPLCEQFEWLRGGYFAALAFAILASLVGVPHSLKMLRLGQSPLPGAWVLRRTRVERGASVRINAYALLALPVVALGFSVWTWNILEPMRMKGLQKHGCVYKLSLGADVARESTRIFISAVHG